MPEKSGTEILGYPGLAILCFIFRRRLRRGADAEHPAVGPQGHGEDQELTPRYPNVSRAPSASPSATLVSSPPPCIRSGPKRSSKTLRTAGTNDEPPVMKTRLIRPGSTPHPSRSASTDRPTAESSSRIHAAKPARATGLHRETPGRSKRSSARSA